ncbi:hydantoinase/oxoprolinase family protein [Streptomyces sp. NPDC020996]|uniref:hydantoinase/oxoprolinase family protein n=1 Tax=Streptomyces sp. NPDC020996 TaxID=3154791 RepID=UPI0033DB4975
MGLLVNIDNGGTFTDVCVTDGDRLIHAKTPTTPHDLTRCFAAGLSLASDRLYGEEDLPRLLRETGHLRCSTTSGTNAVVEHKGTPVALLVDSGAEDDVHEAGGSADPELWAAMVPHRPVGIATGPGGTVDAEEFTAAINALLATNAQRIVIALRDPQAEWAVKAQLLDRYPRHLLGAMPFTLSHELARDADDTRRVLTSVLNSYLHPGMEHFLYSAEGVCKDGGLASPRGGLEGGRAYARLYDADVLVGMDIGGTTTDVSVIAGGQLAVSAFGRVGSAPTSFPMPEIRSVGLGGSSVVEVVDGVVTIGPRSVGAAPGPACFGRGGTSATLTDALLLAGVLDGERYLGGDLKLDTARAERALSTHVGEPLGLSAPAAALAVLRAFEQLTGEALREALTEAGHAPAGTTLLAFGGAGPVIACGIARAAGIGRVIVPDLSAVFSAFGIGFSGLAHEYSVPLPADAAEAERLREELLARARRDMFGEGLVAEDCGGRPRSIHMTDARLDGASLCRTDSSPTASLPTVPCP